MCEFSGYGVDAEEFAVVAVHVGGDEPAAGGIVSIHSELSGYLSTEKVPCFGSRTNVLIDVLRSCTRLFDWSFSIN